jgi:hypothetical protein
MQRHAVASILTAIALMVSPSSLRSQQTWEVHSNPRYGFSLEYPNSLFSLERSSAAGDGLVFKAPNLDALLLVGVIVNDEQYKPAGYFEYIASTSYAGYDITYRKIGPTWFAISGEKDGRIFYEKVQFSCNTGLISSFAMIYPASNQQVLNPVIERMENSFRSARKCAPA